VTDILPSDVALASSRGIPGFSEARRAGGLQPFARSPQEAPDWRRYLAAIQRYRWWILAIVALGTVGGAMASRLLPASYQVQTTIWIQTSDPRGAPDRGPIGANQLFAASAWGDLLKSYVVLEAVVREQRLYLGYGARDRAALATFAVGPEFRPGRYRLRVDRTAATYRLEGEQGVELEKGAVGDPVGRAFGFIWTPTGAELPAGSDVSFVVTPLRDAAKGLADELRVTIDPSGNFLRVTMAGGSGEGAAATANAVTGHYVAVASELKRAKLTELGRLLSEQLQAAEANLRRAERALQDFQERTITLAPDPRAPTAVTGPRGSAASEFFSLKVEQEQLRRDQDALALALAQMQGGGGSADGLAAIGAVQRSADLSQALRELTTKNAERRALAYRYTEDHPVLRRVVGEIDVLEHRTIPALVQTLADELAARDRVLASHVDAGGRELRDIPQRTIEEARLRRDVTIAENLFTSVQQRYSEARLAEASSVADVRVLDAAVAPQQPVKNTGARFIPLGLIAGLGLGLMGAVLADRFDPRVRYPNQVTNEMGLRILSVLPHVQNRTAGPADEHVLQVIEAMRSLRLSLIHAYGAAGPMLVTISSPGIGDGKSFVSTNLALACAQAGQRTLLIDGDARRGGLHRVLQAKRKPGLTDVLAGHAPFEVVRQETSYASLHFIGAGSRCHDSPERLGSPAMLELLARLRGSYEVILVDSPPLGSGVDPYTLGTITGNMLLVLRTGTTNRDLTRTKLAMLDDLPIRLLGAVLNDVRPGGMYGYYAYLSGYGTTDEAAVGVGAAVVTARQRLGGRYRL
jgi:tyrosine-protein kinase Etk/Wzc